MCSIPVIDIFAGPGGLSEGFHLRSDGRISFSVELSFEKDPAAYRTLLLRSFFREFAAGEVPEEYYEYVRGNTLSYDNLLAAFETQAHCAKRKAVCLELG